MSSAELPPAGRRRRLAGAAWIFLSLCGPAWPGDGQYPALRMDRSLAAPAEAGARLAIPAPDGPGRTRPLDLLQALEEAAARSPALARGAEAVNKAEAGVLGAAGAFLPQADLSAQLAHQGNKSRHATLVGTSVVQSEAAFYGSYAALSASINLYSGGRHQSGYQAASAELDAAREDLAALRARQFAQILEGYTALLKAQEEYRGLRFQEQLYASQTEAVESSCQRGLASRVEVSAARLQLGMRRQRTLRQLTALEDRAGQLALGLGLELPGDERLEASEPPPEPPPLPASPADPALADHPALRAATLRLEAARNKVDAARGLFLPKVDLVGGYNWGGQDEASAGGAVNATRASSYSVGLTVQQRLAPFAQETAALGLAQAELREAETRLREVRLGLWNARRQALAEAAQARAALTIAEQAEWDAGEVLSMQLARLRHGRGDERALAEARAEVSQRRLERVFQDYNARLIGWAAHAVIDPRGYVATLLRGARRMADGDGGGRADTAARPG